MIINKLYINDDSVVEFDTGLNIILAVNRKPVEEIEGEEGRTSDTNGVGKSTIVNMMKYLLCGSTEDYLDSKFFTENNVWPSLEVKSGSNEYVLTSPLSAQLKSKVYIVFSGKLEEHKKQWSAFKISDFTGLVEFRKYFESIDNYTVYNKDEYKSFISRLENIDYSDVNLKLSSLMDYVCRDEKLGYGDIVSRVGRTTWVQYRAIQYLFGLPYKVEESSNKYREKVLKLKNELEMKKKFLDEQEIHNQDSLENKRIQFNKDLSEIESELSTLDVTNSNERTREDYQKTKTELVRLNKEINYREKQLVNQKDNLLELNSKQKAVNKLLEAEDFLKDIIENFPAVLKENIENYNQFIGSLAKDRKDYHRGIVRDIKKKLKVLNKEKEDVEEKLSSHTKNLNNTDMIIDISRLTAKEENIKLRIEGLKEAEKFLNECDSLEDDIEVLREEWKGLLKKGKVLQKDNDYRKFKVEIIKLFLAMVKECYNANEGAIEFLFNDRIESSSAGRTEIACSLSSDTSHGRTNSKICIFDYTWFLRTRREGEFNPQFLIHDGPHTKISEHVKYQILKMIDRLSSHQSKQYIITANASELPKFEDFEQNVCITLDGSSEAGKFFGVQYE